LEAETGLVPPNLVEATAPVIGAAPAQTEQPTAEAGLTAEPEVEKSFEEALAEFEAVEDESVLDERERKKKEDRAKRRTLVYDEKLGKVVAKHKSKRARDWTAEDEAEGVESV
jgi:hypothetical protein